MGERHQEPPNPDEVPLPPIGSAPRRTPAVESRPAYARRQPPEQQLWSLIGLGALACVVGGLLLIPGHTLFTFVGIGLLGLGSVLVSIGTIAEGIRVGARWVAYDRGE